jgi:nucleoside-diphosphate-sugar epimerase
VIVHAATALKKTPTRHQGMYPTDDLRVTGTANLIAAAPIVGATRFVGENIVFGYGFRDHGDHVLTEDDPFGVPDPDPGFDRHITGMREKERLPQQVAGLESVSLRYGLFYGGAATDALVSALRKRQLPTFDDRGRVLSWVHIADAADAIVAALAHWHPGAAYNVADESRLGLGGAIREVAAVYRTPRPLRVPVWVLRATPYLHRVGSLSLRVSTARAREGLGWQPRYATMADGLEADSGAQDANVRH